MKKHFFYLIAIAIVSVMLISCNKDESIVDSLEQETEEALTRGQKQMDLENIKDTDWAKKISGPNGFGFEEETDGKTDDEIKTPTHPY